jgi:hypothetical protein
MDVEITLPHDGLKDDDTACDPAGSDAALSGASCSDVGATSAAGRACRAGSGTVSIEMVPGGDVDVTVAAKGGLTATGNPIQVGATPRSLSLTR